MPVQPASDSQPSFGRTRATNPARNGSLAESRLDRASRSTANVGWVFGRCQPSLALKRGRKRLRYLEPSSFLALTEVLKPVFETDSAILSGVVLAGS